MFDAKETLTNIQQYRRTIRRQRYARSKLQRYRAELVQLRQAGASYGDLIMWLKKEKRMKTTHTTVMRFLKKLPEMRGND